MGRRTGNPRGRPAKDRPANLRNVTIRDINGGLWDEAMARAQKEGRTMADLVGEALEHYLAAKLWEEFEKSEPTYE